MPDWVHHTYISLQIVDLLSYHFSEHVGRFSPHFRHIQELPAGNSPVGAGFIPNFQLQTQIINQFFRLLTAFIQQAQIRGILDVRITDRCVQLEFSWSFPLFPGCGSGSSSSFVSVSTSSGFAPNFSFNPFLSRSSVNDSRRSGSIRFRMEGVITCSWVKAPSPGKYCM